MFKRMMVLVMDSVGIGAQHDAESYKSIGANTFYHAAQSHPDFSVPNLQKLGIGNIVGIRNVPSVNLPMAYYGRMIETTSGNDTFAGIWEMGGVVFKERFESFYPMMHPDLVDALHRFLGIKTLCNAYISGFKVLDLYADEHFSSGYPIVYTCDDGVILVAAHEDIISPARLHEIAMQMSGFFVGKKVARIIARAFIGSKGNFVRTKNRTDFIIPFSNVSNHLFYRMREADIPFTTTEHLTSVIGKDYVTTTVPGIKDSAGIMDAVCEYLVKINSGVSIFVVPDFDMSGHAKNPKQYALDIMYFDYRLGEVIQLVRPDDLLFIVADHGCDPVLDIRGHTREYVPLLVLNGRCQTGSDLGTRGSFADLGQTICELIGLDPIPNGRSFAQSLTKEVRNV